MQIRMLQRGHRWSTRRRCAPRSTASTPSLWSSVKQVNVLPYLHVSVPKAPKFLDMVNSFADLYDPYLIYKAGNGQLNNGRDFIFKSSKMCAQMMVEMDEDGPNHVLRGQPAFFDTTFCKVEGFKTVGLWVYHPGEKCSALVLALTFCFSEGP